MKIPIKQNKDSKRQESSAEKFTPPSIVDGFADNRSNAVAQRNLQDIADNSARVKQLMIYQRIADNKPPNQLASQLQTKADSIPATEQKQEVTERDKTNGQNNAAQPIIQRSTYSDGENTYYTETFDTNRERTKQVTGRAKWLKTSGRGGAPPSIALYNPTSDSYEKLLGYDGGHVLGLQLGGVDADYNVVPMLPKFNRDTWAKVESQLIGSAMLIHSGQNHRFVIDLAYADNTSKIPTSLSVKGTAEVPPKNKRRKAVRKEVLNVTKSQPDDIEITPGPTLEEERIFKGEDGNKKKTLKLLSKVKGFSSDEFLKYIFKKKHLPTSLAQDYPDKTSDRPYEYLDILALSGHVFSDSNFIPRKVFTTLQRQLILKFNRSKNGGVLQSDDPTDPHQILDERGAANFPEVDHIIPKSQGGSNFFSNARLVSWQMNNKEDRVKDITPYIGMDRISYPSITGKEPDLSNKLKILIRKWRHEKGTQLFYKNGFVVLLQEIMNCKYTKANNLAERFLPELVEEGFLEEKKTNKYEIIG